MGNYHKRKITETLFSVFLFPTFKNNKSINRIMEYIIETKEGKLSKNKKTN